MLNRAVLIVRPAEPYLAWARSLDDSGVVPDPAGEQTVYLVPEWDDDDEAEEVLALVYEAVFEEELAGWHTDESRWPTPRTLAMFRTWFTVEMHSVVVDLCADPLEDDEL